MKDGELGERLRAARDRLEQSTEALNDAIEEFERALNDLRLGTSGSVTLNEDGALIYSRGSQGWGLYVRKQGRTTPLGSASRAIRVEAATKFGALIVSLLQRSDVWRARVEKVAKFTEAITEATRALGTE